MRFSFTVLDKLTNKLTRHKNGASFIFSPPLLLSLSLTLTKSYFDDVLVGFDRGLSELSCTDIAALLLFADVADDNASLRSGCVGEAEGEGLAITGVKAQVGDSWVCNQTGHSAGLPLTYQQVIYHRACKCIHWV